MQTAIVLCTPDDAQAQAIRTALPWLPTVRCRDLAEAKAICGVQEVELVLVVDAPPECNGFALFAALRLEHPGLAGVLFADGTADALLYKALDAGFSGLVTLPVDGAQVARVVSQALERHRLHQENTRLRTLLPLYSLGEQLAAATDEQEVLDRLLDMVMRESGASHSSVMLHRTEDNCLRVVAARGMDQALMATIQLRPGDKIAGWVFQQGTPVLLDRDNQALTMFSPFLQQPDIVSSICFPLRIRDRIIGVLNISQKETDGRFSEADVEMLAILCSQAAIALDNLQVRRQMADTIRMRTLFEQYVAPEVAELLLAQHTDVMELGGLQQATVLFADIRKFTRLVQRVELPVLRAFLNEFFQFFTEEVFRFRGTVDKFMGDAVLAVFGAPIKLTAPNFAAAHAALTIKARFVELKIHWGHRHPAFLEVDLGIAITCGTVFLGNIGSAQRLDYTVLGNGVNIAQRLAAETSGACIYITEPVRQEIAGSFLVEEQGEIQLRGVEGKTQVACLLGEQPPTA